MTRIFISKNQDEVLSLSQFCEKNKFKLVARTFLSFEAVDFELKENFEVVFFSSIRAANYFLNKKNVTSSVVYACMGKETDKKLKKIGITCSFVGKESGNPEKVSSDFATWLKNKKVLFPHSNLSNFSVLQNLNFSQYKTIQVYQTNNLSSKIPKNDIYIFTSPSNFFSFIVDNKISEKAHLIAFGKSTEKAINKMKISCNVVLKEASLTELELEIKRFLKLPQY